MNLYGLGIWNNLLLSIHIQCWLWIKKKQAQSIVIFSWSAMRRMKSKMPKTWLVGLMLLPSGSNKCWIKVDVFFEIDKMTKYSFWTIQEPIIWLLHFLPIIRREKILHANSSLNFPFLLFQTNGKKIESANGWLEKTTTHRVKFFFDLFSLQVDFWNESLLLMLLTPQFYSLINFLVPSIVFLIFKISIFWNYLRIF